MGDKDKQEEFLGLLEPVQDRLSRFVRTMTWNKEDARDIISETILLAYENFEKIRKKESFMAYLFQIASRLNKRRSWRARMFGYYDEEQAEQIASYNPLPDVNLDVEELYSALKRLPEKQAEAITLFEISGFSLEEIKEIQGGTLSGVKSRLKRGREELTELMNPKPQKKIVLSFPKNENGHLAQVYQLNGQTKKFDTGKLNTNMKVSNEHL
jgi:RNA polymerase sigma-70 factor, ECF subfamily